MFATPTFPQLRYRGGGWVELIIFDICDIPTITHQTDRNDINAHTGNRAPVTSMEGLYDATTLCVQMKEMSSAIYTSFIRAQQQHMHNQVL